MRIAALTCRSFYSLLRGAVSVSRWVQQAADYGYGAVAVADVNSMSGVADLCQAAAQSALQPLVGVEILTENQRAILLAEDDRGYGNLCRVTTARNLAEQFDLVEQLQVDSRGVIGICPEPKLAAELQAVLPRDSLFAGCRDTAEAQAALARGTEPIAWTAANWQQEEDITLARLLARIRQLSVSGSGPGDDAGFAALVPVPEVRERFRTCPRALTNADQLVERCRFQLLKGKPILPKIKLANGAGSDWELARLCHLGLARRYRPADHETIKRLEYELATVRQNGFSDYFLVVHEIVNFAKQSQIPVEVRGSAAGSLIAHVLGFTRVCPLENRLYFERFMNPGRTDCPDIDIDLCWRRRDDVIRFCYEHWGFEHVAMVCNVNRYRLRSAVRDVGRALGLPPEQINQLAREGKIKSTSPIYRLAEKLVDIPRHLGVHCGGIVVTPGPVWEIAPLERANKGVIITQYDKDAAEAVGLVKIDLLGNRSLSTVNEAIQIVTSRGDNRLCRMGFSPGGLGPPTHELSAWAQAHPTRSGGNAQMVGCAVHTVSEPSSAQRRAGHSPPYAFDPNDKKTARMLSAGDSLGVFQSESPGMRQLLRGLRVRSKKDLAIALSLIRPGPASGGMKNEFIERHVHGKPFTYLHPKIGKLLGDTYGVMLYQEDVMRIAVEVAGYTVAEADRFRSEVSKKVSAARVQAQYEDFVHRRAERAGIERRTAEAIWDEVLRFAAYSYCKAHATVYANIAWETAWLKAHYPAAFYCSLFNNHQGMYPLRVYVWDAIRHGVPVLPPHVNHSAIEWSLEGGETGAKRGAGPVGRGAKEGQGLGDTERGDLPAPLVPGASPLSLAIRAGLNIIKGLCSHTARMLLEQRQKADFRDLDDLRRRVKFRKPELQNLIHVGACDGLGPTRPVMLNRLHFALPSRNQLLLFDPCGASVPARAVAWASRPWIQDHGQDGDPKRERMRLGTPARATQSCGDARPAKSVEILPDYDEIAKLEAELDVTGIPFCLHPAVLLPKHYVPAQRLPAFVGRRATVAGFVATARRARTSDNRVMGFVTIEDATGLIEASFFPDQLALYKTICSSGGPVWASGRVVEHLSSLSLDCSACGRIGPAVPAPVVLSS
jgi:DNA polymerase III alpha subunit